MKKLLLAAGLAAVFAAPLASAKSPIDGIYASPPIHVYRGQSGTHGNGRGHGPGGGGGGAPPGPTGFSPQNVKAAYNLPADGGSGMVAIIDAYADPYLQNNLDAFDSYYGLPPCGSGCLTVHPMAGHISGNTGWGLEESLDVEWAHAIAPGAQVLLVEARSSRASDLLDAVSYAAQQPGVVAVSMSWGAGEFSGESAYDLYFTSPYGAAFFAAAGDSGNGVEWPAASVNVTGVGGTTLAMNTSTDAVLSETAWSGSGGGLSQYEPEPAYQLNYGGVPDDPAHARAVPDVSYDADPATGVSVYDSYGYGGWVQVGGTSVGAPNWAAIRALGSNADNASFYADASNQTLYMDDFRDITTGLNGTCALYCTAQAGYDYVTGLGSPLTTAF